ncbi:MAG: hypothetical protein K2Q07_07680, partial [Burkholderiaceae bacterium]|nr:hypothetical protein [Burkholderiaceae bacterium]
MSLPTHVLIETRAQFHSAVRSAFAQIAAAGTRDIWMCDSNFADWPLNDAQIAEHLSQWALPHRRCT